VHDELAAMHLAVEAPVGECEEPEVAEANGTAPPP
jgi:hypothetical protein